MNSNEKSEKFVKTFTDFIEVYKNSSKMTKSISKEIDSLISNINKVRGMLANEELNEVKMSDIEYLLQDIFDKISYTRDENEYRESQEIDFLFVIKQEFHKEKDSNVVTFEFILETENYDKLYLMNDLLYNHFEKRIKNLYFFTMNDFDADGEYVYNVKLWR